MAARLAAAALLDTLDAFEAAFGPGHRHVAMTGDLAAAEQGEEIRDRLASWVVHEQRGEGLGERLANAHADVAATGPGPVVQVGMDTPQVTPALLEDVVRRLRHRPAVLGPAEDGGWWVLALADGARGGLLVDVPMSTDTTCLETERALVAAGSAGRPRRGAVRRGHRGRGDRRRRRRPRHPLRPALAREPGALQRATPGAGMRGTTTVRGGAPYAGHDEGRT